MDISNGLLFTGIIPARYESSRFPGKPLALIGRKPMIQRVYEEASLFLDHLYVATDDLRIYNTVIGFTGKAVMTSADHKSGTDRCAEAIGKITASEGRLTDVVINIQGDEPFIRREQIELLASCFNDNSVDIATLIRKVESGEDISNPNHVKVVTDMSGNAIYFSRAPIPFYRDAESREWTKKHTYYKHIGVYAYRTRTLKKITSLSPGILEAAESLEQNRWLENGFKVRTAVTDWNSIGVDTPEDLEKARKFFERQNKNTYL
jgi:3-deoxy-manno-octulosonate cytidylyltransferase (CMP-KDO synthetase)